MSLLDAVRAGDEGEVARLLALGEVDVDEQSVSTWNEYPSSELWPLFVASWDGRRSIVSMLLAASVDVNQANDDGVTAIFAASHQGHGEIVSALCAAGSAVNYSNSQGLTAIYVASQQGHAEIVSSLIASGAAVDLAANVDGGTALIVASERGHDAVVSKLIAAGAAVNHADDQGNIPLLKASYHGHVNIIAPLIAAGSSVNHTNIQGATATYMASQCGRTQAVSMLIANGAAVNQAVHGGHTPLFAASQWGRTETVAALMAAGAAVNQANDMNMSPLFAACMDGRLGCVQLLCSHGASRTMVHASGEAVRADWVAHARGHAQVVAWLQSTALWSTPLHYLTILSPSRAWSLLRAGAVLNAAAAVGGPTPLSLATAMRNQGLARAGSAADLVFWAAEPWSPRTHWLFPAAARARAVELLVVGRHLSRELRLAGRWAGAIADVWLSWVMPHAVQRDFQYSR